MESPVLVDAGLAPPTVDAIHTTPRAHRRQRNASLDVPLRALVRGKQCEVPQLVDCPDGLVAALH